MKADLRISIKDYRRNKTSKFCSNTLPSRDAKDVNRDGGTASANGGWLLRLVGGMVLLNGNLDLI